jgi:hypothetical protein
MKIRTGNQMTKKSPEPIKEMKSASPLRRTLAALGMGSVAQYTLTHGFPLLGMAGYGIAIWLFVPPLGRYLEHVSLEEEGGLDGKLFKEEILALIDTFAVIKNNWRQMTISEIFSGSFKPPDDDVLQGTLREDD